MLLGDMISELRKDHQLTQKDLAKILNVSNATISHYESSVNLPDIATVVRIANFFGVSTDYLLGRTRLKMDFETFKREVRLPDGSVITAEHVLELFIKLSDQSQVDIISLMNLFELRDRICHNEIIRPLELSTQQYPHKKENVEIEK